MTPRIGSLFSGYGGLDLAVEEVLSGETVWHCEVEPAPSKILAARWPGVPNLGDVTAVDWAAVEPVDVICGGSPCQDVSAAGKRAGMRAGTRSGLWASMCDAIDIIRPRLVVWENVRGVLSAEADSALEPCPGCVGDGDDGAVLRALGRVLGDLADIGYDASWHGLRAADVGATHGRFRIFVVARDATELSSDVGVHDGASVAKQGVGGRWSAAGRTNCSPAPDADKPGSQGREPAAGRNLPDRGAAADTPRDGRDEGRPELARIIGGSDAAQRGAATADAECGGWDGRSYEPQRQPLGRVAAAGGRIDAPADADGHRFDGNAELDSSAVTGLDSEHRGHIDGRPHGTDWGAYTSAIRRWERVLGRPAPTPTELATRGGQRLSPQFVEWMMGLPAGWVTDVPGISRNDQLKALGNGVVPQQAAAALRHLLAASSLAA